MELDQDLTALEPLGGFFALRTGAAPQGPLPTLARAYGDQSSGAGPGTEPAAGSAAEPGTQSDPITFRVEKVARTLRAPEARIAASVAHLGLAARLWSVTLGCAVLCDRVPDLDPALLHWDPGATAPDDLWLSEVRALPAHAASVADTVLVGHLEPLAAALRARHRIAAGLLRGNAASALAGAARQLEQWAVRHGRDGSALRTRALTAQLLGHPLLSATGTLTGTAFRRRSCCLYYRVPGGGVCGDCCFLRPPRSSARDASG
ncbi:(2Fe-2S)-binding protein [Streptomyces sp. NPDC101225]|uniref:(2Fe-2S)-binding protein n=1 Tax=Streptomyces sp. NPDC101225 TaxID=3366135 RepID=UPI0037FB17E8